VYRPAVDVRGRGHTIAALAAVFAVLVMHGLSCMAGSAHMAGMPVAGGPPGTHQLSDARPGGCQDCHHRDDVPAGNLRYAALGVPPTASAWVIDTEHQGEHGGLPCIVVLTGLALLVLLAAAAAVEGLPVVAADGAWLRLRPRPPTALLRPSLSTLCVLRI
jgi:hypothetical protein